MRKPSRRPSMMRCSCFCACAQGRCATRLRYAPTFEASLILNHFQYFRYCQAAQIGPKSLRPWHNRDKTPSVDLTRVKTRPAFVRLPVDLLQSLPFHLQFHLRILLEHLGVALPRSEERRVGKE